jgi:hypothetical protein
VTVKGLGRHILAAVVAVLTFASAAHAQGQPDLERFNRQLELIERNTLMQVDQGLSLDQRALFEYGGYFNFGYLSADDNNNDNHILRQYEILGYARFNPDGGANEFFLRGVWGWQDFNPGDSFNGEGDQPIDGELDVYYYKFDLARYQAAYYGKKIDYNLVIKAGSDLVTWGNGLSLSVNVTGLNAIVSWGGNDVTLLAGVTPTRTVDWDSSRPAFDYDTRRGFYGAMISRDVSGHRPYVYGLMERDYNYNHNVSQTGPITTDFDYNAYYIGIGSTGPIGDRMIYGVEAVYEGGNNLSNSFTTAGPFLQPIPQTRDEVQAWAADARLDYLFPGINHSRLSCEAILASGDSDRGTATNTFNGNTPNTKDNGFNSLGLINTGLAFAPAVSNLLAFRVGGSTIPLPEMGALRRMQVGTDVFIYNKMLTDAPIDEPSNDQRFLGWEPDFFVNWQITSDVTVVGRYGIFFPNGAAFESDQPRQYIYGGVTYAF